MRPDAQSFDHAFDSQAGRDLAWALHSPSLMDHERSVSERWGARELARNQGLAARLDKPDSPLHRALRERQIDRLGEYFERLVVTWLEYLPPATLLGANEQVHRADGTLGEFDVVFRRDGVVHHWELAVKFYLGFTGPNGTSAWYGPNPVDKLGAKWRRMLRHQLRLSQTSAGRRVLEDLGVGSDEDVEASALIRGYFFDPLDDYRAEDHPDANERAVRGWWVHRDRLEAHVDRLDPDGDLRWMRLSGLRWMSPARADERDNLYDLEALARFLHPNRPSLVAGLADTDRGLREVTRGFVVPDGWPRG
ncbi:MAG: DUF1853 family protein [Persicimonas sp.]